MKNICISFQQIMAYQLYGSPGMKMHIHYHLLINIDKGTHFSCSERKLFVYGGMHNTPIQGRPQQKQVFTLQYQRCDWTQCTICFSFPPRDVNFIRLIESGRKLHHGIQKTNLSDRKSKIFNFKNVHLPDYGFGAKKRIIKMHKMIRKWCIMRAKRI